MAWSRCFISTLSIKAVPENGDFFLNDFIFPFKFIFLYTPQKSSFREISFKFSPNIYLKILRISKFNTHLFKFVLMSYYLIIAKNSGCLSLKREISKKKLKDSKKEQSKSTKSNFYIPKSTYLQSGSINIWFFKLKLFKVTEFIKI